MKVKVDLYTKVVLTVIALCLVFNVLKEVNVIPNIYAQEGSNTTNNIAPITAPSVQSTLRTNDDGSINVRMVSADVIEVKPASNATFQVKPSSSSTFEVKPSSNASFKVEPTSYKSAFKIEPANNAVFTVKQQTASIASEQARNSTLRVYPNPAKDNINIEYDNTSGAPDYLTIFDINGKVINNIPLEASSNILTLNISGYSPGVYIYRLNDESGKFIVR